MESLSGNYVVLGLVALVAVVGLFSMNIGANNFEGSASGMGWLSARSTNSVDSYSKQVVQPSND